MIRHNGIEIDRVTMTVRYGAKLYSFQSHGKQAFRAWEMLILNGWTSRSALFDRLYDDREDGGPLSARNVLDVQLNQWRPKLAQAGLIIEKDRRSGETYFRIRPFDVEAAAQRILRHVV